MRGRMRDVKESCRRDAFGGVENMFADDEIIECAYGNGTESGNRRRQSDVEQVRARHLAHEIGHRHTHDPAIPEGLEKDEPGAAATVIKTHVTKQNAYLDTVNGKSFEIICCCCNDILIRGEDSSQGRAVEPHDVKYHKTDTDGDSPSIIQSLFRAFRLLGAHILSNKGRHRLHKRNRNQQHKTDDLPSNAIPGRKQYAHAVGNGVDGKKRKLCNQIFQGHRRADGKQLPDRFTVEADVFSGKLKGQFDCVNNKNG